MTKAIFLLLHLSIFSFFFPNSTKNEAPLRPIEDINAPPVMCVTIAPPECESSHTDPVLHEEHCFLLNLLSNPTYNAVNSGSWFDPATWAENEVPQAGANVWIDNNVSVQYDGVSDVNLTSVRVDGALHFAHDVPTRLKAETVMVAPGATMTIGTTTNPIAANVTAQIVFPDLGPIDTNEDPTLLSKGLITHGSFETHGAVKTAFLALAVAPSAGASVLELAEIPVGWQVGDNIVLAGTYADWNGSDADNTRFHDEELTITSIVGSTLTFSHDITTNNTLLYDHLPPAGYGLSVHVANLTRNIRIETENFETVPVLQRGHFMAMHSPAAHLRYTGFYGLGRTNKDEDATDPVLDGNDQLISGGENPRGRYGCHFHRTGSDDIGSSPMMVVGNALVNTPGWGYVNHNSHVIMEDNVAYEFLGAAFITEDGNELGAFRRNIAIKGMGDSDPDRNLEVSDRTANFDLGFNGDGFWMQTANVTYEDNVAASLAGSAFFLFADDDVLQGTEHVKFIDVDNLANTAIAAADDEVVVNAAIPVRAINGMTAYNASNGFSSWMHMRSPGSLGAFVFHQEIAHAEFSLIENFEFWNMLTSGINFSYTSQTIFRNGLILGDLDNQWVGSNWPNDRNENTYYNRKAGVIANGLAGSQIIYDNLRVEGWQMGIMSVKSGQGNYAEDINYNTSRLQGGYFNHNLINIFPQPANDIALNHVHHFARFFEITGSPEFHIISANTLPTAAFSSAAAGGLAMDFDGTTSLDPDYDLGEDPYVTELGNGIAAYHWDYGDGNTGFGEISRHTYSSGGNYTVTLTVYDMHGATHSTMQNITVNSNTYPEILLNGDFSSAIDNHYLLSNHYNQIDQGWFRTHNDWQVQGGQAVVNSAVNYEIGLGQAVQNDWLHQGMQTFQFDAINTGAGANGNLLRVQIFGVNSEFRVQPRTNEHPNEWNNNDPNYHYDALLEEEFGFADYDWTTFQRDIDFGTGYQFIVIKINTAGVAAGDMQAIDNVSLGLGAAPPLAVELLDFSGKVAAQSNDLSWQLAVSKDIEEFVVERSIDGLSGWETIGKVDALNTLAAESYDFRDREPYPTSYYRLRIVESDQKDSYSEVLVLTRSNVPSQARLMPNQVEDVTVLEMELETAALVEYVIVDAGGREVEKGQFEALAGAHRETLRLGHLGIGVYFMWLDFGEGKEVLRLVKR